jgi:hypothetical protein
MKSKFYVCLRLICLLAALAFSNCAKARQNDFSQYNLSLKNTLSIFLVNNENGWLFCIPIQYTGGYQIGRFKFVRGNILIGDYDIFLKNNNMDISVYLNEKADEEGSGTEGFNLVYQEKEGRAEVSKMAEPLAEKNDSGYLNHYYIFIEKYLTKNEMKNIIEKYKKGNVYSKMEVWFDLTIDNEEQNGSGILDDFELYSGVAIDPSFFPPNLNFFKVKYLQKELP